MSDEAEDTHEEESGGRLKAYLQLIRLPNVFTAMADVLAGFLITHPLEDAPWGVLAWLLASSCSLYTAGMVLNDVFDAKEDAEERPFRPIPSGRISRGFAMQLGIALLILGVGCGGLSSYFAGRAAGAAEWRPAIVATGLAVLVVLYDRFLKRTVLGPFVMGACRFGNVLLGMSAAATQWNPAQLNPLQEGPVPWDQAHYLIAAGIGIYIVGVTWFARSEAQESPRGLLLLGMFFMAAGFGTIALFPRFLEGTPPILGASSVELDARIDIRMWYLWLLILGLFLLMRLSRAVADPAPERVQAGVKQAIMWLIFLDTAACAAVRCYVAIVIVLLLIPAMFLGKWVYST